MRSLFLSLIVLLCIGSCTPLNSGVTLTGQITEEISTTFRPCQGCGNGKCDYPSENCVTCPDDCGKCAPCVVKCGNGICDGNETACNCPEDCGTCCLDGVCDADGGETYANCADCSANLNVTVVDSLTYNSLPGSVVQCTSSQFPIGPLTSESGEFSFKKIPSGLYTCTATHFSYTPNVVTFSVLSSFKNMTVRIPLTQEKGTVEGVTYDLATNEPLTNTMVSCSNGTYHTDTVLTDKFGQFVFADVAPGYWVCTGSREGYQTTSNDGTLVSGGLVRIDLILRSIPASVQGYVTQNGTNTPIIAPTVVCTQGNLSKTFVGNDVGFYITDNVDPAFISCTASRDGYGSETKSAIVGIGQIMVINFTLPVKASILTGDISDSVTGFRISGANVTCVNLDNLTAVADNNGVYSINNIFAGSWNCTAERNGWFPRSSPIQIQPGMPQYLPFVLDPKPASLAGVVVDTTGNPILLASVNCVFTILPNTQPNLGPLSTNSTGNFIFENIIFKSSLVQLAFTCEATKSGFGTGTKTGTLKRGDDAFITIQLILLGIQVTVKDLDSALPVPGATVVCDGPTTSSDTSNAAGITLFDGISLGSYNCSASLTGYTGDSARVTISSSSGIVNLTLNIQLTRYLVTGKVIDADDGSALTSASLVIRDGTGTLDLVQVPLNETSAEFKVLLVLPARYNFYAENGINYLPANPFVTLGPNNYSTPLFLRVAAISSTITGEVINNATGASLKNALLDLFSVSGVTTTYLFSATSSDDGTFQFTQVNRGNFKLRVTAEGYLTTESTFTISRLGITVARTVRIDPDIYGRVSGKIVRTLSGGSVVGIADATITLVNIANSIQVFTNTTGADGSYFFAQVPAGRTTATASKDGFKSNTLAFDVTIGTTNSINDIILQPLVGSVVGTLYKVFGGTRTACNCFATITIYPTGVSPIPSNAVGSVSVATGNSNYSFPDLAIGQYFLVSQDLTTQQQFRVDNVNVAADTATTVDIQMN